MSRPSVHDELKRRLMEHLAIAETYPPEERPLDVRSVAAVLRISPTTLYKYGLNRQINAAEQRQRENWVHRRRRNRAGLLQRRDPQADRRD